MLVLLYLVLRLTTVALICCVLAVVAIVSATTLEPERPARAFALSVAWLRLALLSMVAATRFRPVRAITLAFTTYMSELSSCALRKVRFPPNICCRLASGYSTARTPLSTKITSERYSDL